MHVFPAALRWALKVVTSLLIIGFPIACLMAWGFEFKAGVVRPVPSMPRSEAASVDALRKGRGSGLLLTGLVLAVLLAGFALMQWRAAGPEAGSARASTPVVVIMDTAAPRGVYDQDVRNAGGTNADSLTEALRDLPVLLQKETVGATWAREDQVLKQTPSLILIHRSSFFHSMNQEFGFGYPGEPGFDEARHRWRLGDRSRPGQVGRAGGGQVPGSEGKDLDRRHPRRRGRRFDARRDDAADVPPARAEVAEARRGSSRRSGESIRGLACNPRNGKTGSTA